jgi:hypothetical protein
MCNKDIWNCGHSSEIARKMSATSEIRRWAGTLLQQTPAMTGTLLQQTPAMTGTLLQQTPAMTGTLLQQAP